MLMLPLHQLETLRSTTLFLTVLAKTLRYNSCYYLLRISCLVLSHVLSEKLAAKGKLNKIYDWALAGSFWCRGGCCNRSG